MKLQIQTEILPPGWWWDPKRPVRGTDKFYSETAKAAVHLGWDVDVIYDGEPTTVGGVEFMPRNSDRVADHYLICNPKPDTVDKDLLPEATIWTNFYLNNYDPWLKSLNLSSDCDLVVISNYAKSLFSGSCVDPRVVPHGVDHSIFYPPAEGADRKPQCVYLSSPDRGLGRLQAFWRDYDIEACTGYSLVTTPYGKTDLSDDDIADLLRESAYWLHPGDGVELFCLAAVEAQACGCVPIVVPTGALTETVQFGHRLPSAGYEAGLYGILSGPGYVPAVNADHVPDWLEVTKRLLP